MKKIYDVSQLLKPVRLYEQDSDATEAEDVDKKDEDQEKNNTNEEKKEDGNTEEKADEKNNGDSQENKDQNTEQNNQEQNNEQNQANQGNVQAQQNALNGVSKSLMDCSVELDNIYKNNNLKKYGMGVENAYKGVMRFVWPAIGITVAATVAFLCMKGIIPAKKVLSKVPLIGKLFQGDKAAINSVQQSLLFTGTNKATQIGTQAINNIGNKPQQAQTVGNSTVAPEAQTQPENQSTTDQAQAGGQNVDNTQGGQTQVQGDANSQNASTEEKSEEEWKAIQQRITQQKASNEDMKYAYKQYKDGKYNNAGPATRAYFGALDQGKSHDEAQQIADQNNPKKQQAQQKQTVAPENTAQDTNNTPNEQSQPNSSTQNNAQSVVDDKAQDNSQTQQNNEQGTQNNQVTPNAPQQNNGIKDTANEASKVAPKNSSQTFTDGGVKVTSESSMNEGWATNSVTNSNGLVASGVASNLTDSPEMQRTWIGLYDSKNQLHTLMYKDGKLTDTNGRLVGLSNGARNQLMNSAQSNLKKGITLEKFMGA